MRTIYFILFNIIATSIGQAQQHTFIQVMDSISRKTLDNVLVFNLNTKDYNYSNQDGTSKIEYMQETDSIRVFLPGYREKLFIVSELQSNNLVSLSVWHETLAPIVLNNESGFQNLKIFKFKNKKSRYIGIDSQRSIKLVSSYQHKICKNCNLIEALFFVDTSEITDKDEVFVRPIILDENFKVLLSSVNAIPLAKNQKNVRFNFSSQPLLFNKNENFYIGIEIFNKVEKNFNIGVRSLSKKRTKSFLKRIIEEDWFLIDSRLSLNYKLFFQ
ncbi:MAG TPA: hypothetical protein VK050_10560 [Flavobacteriaceae bacterium]|nr:hypothetical protein [Flavobacteriaceae bacterium]